MDPALSAAQFGTQGDLGSSGTPSTMGAGDMSADTAGADAPWMSGGGS